jgi:hypothetical protein
MKKLQVIIGIIIFVSVFLPWASVNFGFGFKETAVGTDHSSGILVLIMGLGCAALAFLPNPRFRRLGQLATGVIALIGVAIYWGAATGELRGLGVPVSPGPGFIICIIAAAAAVITAIRRPAASSARVENLTAAQATEISSAIPRAVTRSATVENLTVARETDFACPACGAELHRTRVEQ